MALPVDVRKTNNVRTFGSRLWFIASIVLAAPGGCLPLLDVLRWVAGLVGTATLVLSRLHDAAEAFAYQSLVWTMLSGLAAIMSTGAVPRGWRWVLWIAPGLAVIGSLSFWMRMFGWSLGS